jgi:beta-glucanase (GH16 family)
VLAAPGPNALVPNALTSTSLESPANEQPAKAPMTLQLPAKEASGSESSAKEPPAENSPAPEPPAEEPPATEPPAKEPRAEEPPAKEPSVKEPPAIEPPAKEPPAKEPPAKESPTTESPVAEEPKAPAPPAGTSPIESDPPSSRKLAWSDEFSGPAGTSPDAAKWSFDTGGGGWGNEELESYTSRPANAELDGQGDLAITARAEKYTGADGVARDYTSARLQTLNTFQFQYGLVEARIKVPAGQGLVAQFWALGHEAYEGSEGWPDCGEIDTMEVLGSEPNVANGTLHAPWSWAPTGVQGSKQTATPLSAGFHVYAVEWEPERISFMLDGSVYKTITPADLPAGAAWPFKHPYFLLLDLAVGGEWPGAPNASTHFPAQMLVDWVRVWQ